MFSPDAFAVHLPVRRLTGHLGPIRFANNLQQNKCHANLLDQSPISSKLALDDGLLRPTRFLCATAWHKPDAWLTLTRPSAQMEPGKVRIPAHSRRQAMDWSL